MEKEQKVSESQSSNKSTTPFSTSAPRPAVILLDENVTEQGKTTESESSELTFGFEVNEQLLLSEDEEAEEEETPTVSPDLSRFSNSPPSFNRAPPMFEKHKFAPNYPYIPMHPGIIPGHPTMMVPVPYMNCPTIRFPIPYMMHAQQQPPPPLPPATVIDKCRNQSKEDFSSRYIAPDESHVQKFNHDKIVSFVGLGESN